MLRKEILVSIRALVAALFLAPALPVAAELTPPAQPLVTPASPAPPAASTETPGKRGFSIDPNG
jgi:hypothetical protein